MGTASVSVASGLVDGAHERGGEGLGPVRDCHWDTFSVTTTVRDSNRNDRFSYHFSAALKGTAWHGRTQVYGV